jgi:hypothetical protein
VTKEWVFGGQGMGIWWPRIEFGGHARNGFGGQGLVLMTKD